MDHSSTVGMVELDSKESIWENCYTVFPLVVVGTVDADGSPDLAPKHLAMPMSWRSRFGFVCSSSHSTYRNIARDHQFTVTYIRPEQAVLASLAASPRCNDGSKPVTAALPTTPASRVAAPLLKDGYLYLECELDRIIDELDENSLIIGRIIAARVADDAIRRSDQDDQDLVHDAPLMAYLYPGRFAAISASNRMPFPTGFKR